MYLAKMKYYILEKQILYDPNDDYSVLPDVNGSTILDSNLKKNFKLKKIDVNNLIKCNDKIINHFSFHYMDKKKIKFHDKMLLDAYKFLGTEVPITVLGFLVSNKLKEILLDKFILGSDSIFCPAKLKYDNTFIDYNFFQFIYNKDDYDLNKFKVFGKLNNERRKELEPNNESDFFNLRLEYLKYRKNPLDFKLNIHMNKFTDIVFVPRFGQICISERLKNEFEKNEIKGFNYRVPENYFLTFENINEYIS